MLHPETIRFASLNLLDKAHGYAERLKTLEQNLIKNDIEVISLQEATFAGRQQLEEMMTRLGYEGVHSSEVVTVHGDSSMTAVYSKYPIVSHQEILFNDELFIGNPIKSIPAIMAEVKIGTKSMFFISAHLAWGTHAEHLRLHQAMTLSRIAEELRNLHGRPVTIGADMNSEEQSDTIRYMHGYHTVEGKSHLWVDAFRNKGKKEEWVTSNPDTYYGRRSALSSQPGQPTPDITDFPERRIDYIFSYGWCYGRPGGPKSYQRFGTEATDDTYEQSDHYGIFADLII